MGVEANRQSHSGVWVGEAQIAAIGISVKHWVTMHGIALNVKPQERNFRLINPCGMAGVPVTSVDTLTGRDVPLEEVADIIVSEFRAVFDAGTMESDRYLLFDLLPGAAGGVDA
jgi:lipoate-protein ligase B